MWGSWPAFCPPLPLQPLTSSPCGSQLPVPALACVSSQQRLTFAGFKDAHFPEPLTYLNPHPSVFLPPGFQPWLSLKQQLPLPTAQPLVATILLSVSIGLATLGPSLYVESYRISIFMTGVFHLTQCPWGSSMLKRVMRFLPFIRLNNTPFYAQTTLCLSIHVLMDTWLLPPLGSCGKRCFEHGRANVSSRSFQCFWVYTQKWDGWLVFYV